MPSARYQWFKGVLFALLAADALWYLHAGALGKGMDATAWLVLLALFELETGYGERLRARFARGAVRAIRFLAAAAVVATAVGYAYDNQSLDAVNSALWIGVVALLEFEVRYSGALTRHRGWFAASAAALYLALAILVVIWAWRGEWFDAYDALLWLIAFMTIELGVLRFAFGHSRNTRSGALQP